MISVSRGDPSSASDATSSERTCNGRMHESKNLLGVSMDFLSSSVPENTPAGPHDAAP